MMNSKASVQEKREVPHALPVLPQQQAIEKALLFAMLTSQRIHPDLALGIRPDMFTHPDIRLAMEAFFNLYNRGELPEPLSLEKEMKAISPDRIDNLPPLYQVAKDSNYLIVDDLHVKQHMRILKETFTLRELIIYAQDIALKASRPDAQVTKALQELDGVVNKLMEQLTVGNISASMKENAAQALGTLTTIRQRIQQGEMPGISTYLTKLNQLTGGLMNSSLIILAGRPGQGKTALALFFALKAAQSGKHVCIYSLEMSTEQLLYRLAGALCDIEPSKMVGGTLTDPEMKQVEEALHLLETFPIHITFRSGITMPEIRNDVLLHKRRGECDLVVIDYLQLMNHDEKAKTTNDAVGSSSKQAKQLAMEGRIPVVLLSQLNRKCEDRTVAHIPVLSDLRDSGSIEQDADVVMFIHRLWPYGKTNDPDTGQSTFNQGTILVRKNRFGNTGDIPVIHNDGVTYFRDKPGIDPVKGLPLKKQKTLF